MASIDPEVFVDLIIKQKPPRQRVIMMGFKGRYEHGQLKRELAAEAPWLLLVRGKLASEASSMSPIGKYRIDRFIQWFIDPVLEREIDAAEKQVPGE